MKRGQQPVVVVFSTAYLPFVGGAELAVWNITKRIKTARFFVVTARMKRNLPGVEHIDGVEVRRVGFGISFDKWLLPVLGALEGARIARKSKHVLLWSMMVSQGAVAAYIIKKMRPQIPLVVTLQEGDAEAYLDRGRFGLIRFFWKRILPCADAVTAISQYLALRAQKVGFRESVSIIPNGVDEQYVSESFERPPRETLKQDLGIDADEQIILSVSRLVEKNGIDDLIRAFAKLLERGYLVRLVLVGDGAQRENLKTLARKLSVSKKILFAGTIAHDQLLRYYRMSDVFCRPSRSEGLGSVFLEAMGTGVPVVAARVGGIADFLEDGKTGFAVRAGDADDIARGITEALDNAELRGQVIKNAREMIIQKYLWVDIASRMEKVFLEHLS